VNAPLISEPVATARDVAAGRWAEALVRFNLDPVDYADPSWLPHWAPSASPRVRQELSRGLLREQGLETLCDWAIEDRAARFFMIDAGALDRLGLAVGIASHRDSLRQIVRKDQLTALRECFGAASSTVWLAVAETVPRADEPLALSSAAFDSQALVQRFKLDGKRQLLRLLDDAEPAQRAVAWRARFCLPRPADGHAASPPPALPAAHAARMTEAIVADLITPWAPAWTWLF
jgi:YOP proteins translocation protein K (YscK)